MSEARLTTITIGSSPAQRTIAVRVREGKSPSSGPGLFWLGGFKSDMKGTKAEALDRWAESAARACVRFDYSGHGESGGDFQDGTIGRWLEESLGVYTPFRRGPADCHWFIDGRLAGVAAGAGIVRPQGYSADRRHGADRAGSRFH